MKHSDVKSLDLCWWLARFAVLVTLPFVVTSQILSGNQVTNDKLVLSTIGAALLLAAVLVDSFQQRRSPWLFPLVEPGHSIRISASQAVIVIAWFIAFYAFLWWFLLADAVR